MSNGKCGREMEKNSRLDHTRVWEYQRVYFRIKEDRPLVHVAELEKVRLGENWENAFDSRSHSLIGLFKREMTRDDNKFVFASRHRLWAKNSVMNCPVIELV